jgi:hypothetical protein
MGKFWAIRFLYLIGLTNLSDVEILELEVSENKHLPRCNAIISIGCPHVCCLQKGHSGKHKTFGNAGLPGKPIPFILEWMGDFNQLRERSDEK